MVVDLLKKSWIKLLNNLTLILGAEKADNVELTKNGVVNHVFCGSMMGLNTAANTAKTVCSK